MLVVKPPAIFGDGSDGLEEYQEVAEILNRLNEIKKADDNASAAINLAEQVVDLELKLLEV